MLLGLLLAVLSQAPAGYDVSGRVVNAVTGQPVTQARVFLAPVNARDKDLVWLTGPTGMFLFQGVPAGHYSLSAERNGFGRQAFGQKTLYQNYSTSVAVGENENSRDLLSG
jgi:hypothetical protein